MAIITESQAVNFALAGKVSPFPDPRPQSAHLPAHLRFLEIIDQVNRVVHQAADIEQLMGGVLDVVLEALRCDRVFLMYPLDPDTPYWFVPMERTRPEYPGAEALNLRLATDPQVAETFRILLDAPGPVRFGPGTDHAVPSDIHEHYFVQCFMSMALRPKKGKPWQFGVHQCSHLRVWTPDDERIFQEIGRRLEIALTSLLIQQELRESEARLRDLVRSIPDLVWLKDPSGVFLACNRQFERLLNAPESAIVGKTDDDFQPPELAERYRANDRRAIAAGGPIVSETWLTFADNGYRGLFESIKTPMTDAAGKLIGVLGVARDITHRHEAEQRIQFLAYHDPLTRLPNRHLLGDRVQHAQARCGSSGRTAALYLVDLDGFRLLNDTLGHEAGDRLLVEVAKRLAACVRESDTVARFATDEFALIVEDLSGDPADALTRAQAIGSKMLGALAQPHLIGGSVCRSTAGIGVVLFHDASVAVEELLKQAHIAMGNAKSSGRNVMSFFDPAMQAAILARTALEAALHDGLERGEFVLNFQPQISVSRGIVGAEVLLRWHSPERGIVLPTDFIAMAEATGLILPIGQWVLEGACRLLAAWSDHPALGRLRLSVNVSARQFRQADFVAIVRATIERTGARANALTLELTESLAIEDIDDTVQKMSALQSCGVDFSMDDFGTGSSSLTYLSRLPFDELKVDQSFIRKLPQHGVDAAVVKTIITLGRGLGITVVAEGVETEPQRSFLEAQGCPICQGFLFASPMELDEFVKFVEAASDKARDRDHDHDHDVDSVLNGTLQIGAFEDRQQPSVSPAAS